MPKDKISADTQRQRSRDQWNQAEAEARQDILLEKGTQRGKAEASGEPKETKKEGDSEGNDPKEPKSPREKSIPRTTLDGVYTGIAAKKEGDGETRAANAAGLVDLFDEDGAPIDADNDAGEPDGYVEETHEQRAYRIRTEVT